MQVFLFSNFEKHGTILEHIEPVLCQMYAEFDEYVYFLCITLNSWTIELPICIKFLQKSNWRCLFFGVDNRRSLLWLDKWEYKLPSPFLTYLLVFRKERLRIRRRSTFRRFLGYCRSWRTTDEALVEIYFNANKN